MTRWMLASLLLVGALGTLAAETVDRSLRAEPDGAVRVDLAYGRIRITGTDSDQVRVHGTIGERLSGIALENEAGAVEIRARLSWISRLRSLRGGSPPYQVDLLIEVPEKSRLFVVSRDADISIEGVRGPIGVGVVSSTVVIRGEPAFVSSEAASGSLDFEGRTADLKASTLSGDLRVVGVDGVMTLETATGSVKVGSARLRRARLETISGAIDVGRAVEPGGPLEIVSVSGEVRLTCCSAGVMLDLESRDGEIFNEVNELDPVRDDRGFRVLKFAPEPGGAPVRVRTRSGHIWLLPSETHRPKESPS